MGDRMIIDSKEIEFLLNKYVAIGVPNDVIPNRLFFYFGWLKYVDSTEVKIETNAGYKIISIGNIFDIHLVHGGQPCHL